MIGGPSTASNRWLCCHSGNYQNIEHQPYAETYPGPHGGLRTFVGVLVVPHAPKHPSNDGEHEAEETEAARETVFSWDVWSGRRRRRGARRPYLRVPSLFTEFLHHQRPGEKDIGVSSEHHLRQGRRAIIRDRRGVVFQISAVDTSAVGAVVGNFNGVPVRPARTGRRIPVDFQ